MGTTKVVGVRLEEPIIDFLKRKAEGNTTHNELIRQVIFDSYGEEMRRYIVTDTLCTYELGFEDKKFGLWLVDRKQISSETGRVEIAIKIAQSIKEYEEYQSIIFSDILKVFMLPPGALARIEADGDKVTLVKSLDKFSDIIEGKNLVTVEAEPDRDNCVLLPTFELSEDIVVPFIQINSGDKSVLSRAARRAAISMIVTREVTLFQCLKLCPKTILMGGWDVFVDSAVDVDEIGDHNYNFIMHGNTYNAFKKGIKYRNDGRFNFKLDEADTNTRDLEAGEFRDKGRVMVVNTCPEGTVFALQHPWEYSASESEPGVCLIRQDIVALPNDNIGELKIGYLVYTEFAMGVLHSYVKVLEISSKSEGDDYDIGDRIY